MICIRDLLNNVPKGQVEMIRKALACAGWDGNSKFESENYLMAELVLSNQAAENVLDRTMKKQSEWSNWWTDMGSHCKMKFGNNATLREFGILIGYNLLHISFRR